MGRTNKTLQGAFINIAGTDKERSLVEQFLTRNADAAVHCGISLANSPAQNQTGQYSLAKFMAQYKTIAAELNPQVQLLARLETVILQLSAKANLKDIILYFNKGKYIYARCPFYRFNNEVNEIRTIVGLASNYLKSDSPLESLYDDENFMSTVKEKITSIMDQEIVASIEEYDMVRNEF